MAISKPFAFVSEESSEVQALDSRDPLITASSSTLSSSSARVMDSTELLVPTVQSVLDDPVAGPSGIASGSGDSQSANASSSDQDEFFTMSVYRPSESSARRTHPNSDELRLMWNWRKIFSKLGTHEQCVQFAEERGLLPTEKTCTYHRKPMIISRESGQLGRFRCRKSNCRTKDVSRASGTWFEEARLPLTLIFQIMYAFSEGLSYHQARKEVTYEDSPIVSSRTVAHWYKYCRKVLATYEVKNQRVWLGEYSWRRRIYRNLQDPYEELLKAIKDVYSK